MSKTILKGYLKSLYADTKEVRVLVSEAETSSLAEIFTFDPTEFGPENYFQLCRYIGKPIHFEIETTETVG